MKSFASPSLIKRLLISGAAVSAFLMVVNVYLSARVSQDGLMIDTLAKKEMELKRQIARLEQEKMSKTSLTDLSQRAEAMGYTKATDIITITASMPVAAK